MTGFCEVLGRYASAAARADDDDVRLNDMRVVGRLELEKTVFKAWFGLPIFGRIRVAGYLTKDGVSLTNGLESQGRKDFCQGPPYVTA